jgi:hypothetical protein
MITNAYRIACAERVIAMHVCEIDPEASRVACTADDAADLLLSLALWAECNGVCLRIPKPIYEEFITGQTP